MKTHWIHLLACPQCQGSLDQETFQPSELLAREGILICKSCSSWFPIKGGIARLLVPGPLRHDDEAFLKKWRIRRPGPWIRRIKARSFKQPQAGSDAARQVQAQVQKVFEFKWKRQKNWGLQGGSADFMEKWMFTKYGWRSQKGYESSIRKHHVLLDAGCGLGREALRMARAHPQGLVVGLELSACVEEAKQHADEQRLSNLLFVQGDLMSPPFRKSTFDFILSEGVLHHTPDTEAAFRRLSRLIRPHGEFAFYVYRKKAPLREFADDYVRSQLQNIPLEEAWKMMEPLTLFGKTMAESSIRISIPKDIPVLGFKQGKYDLQRWIYNALFKCFWNDAMSFQENVLINFDWYLPRYAWRHSEDQIRRWIAGENMTLSQEFVEDAGITVRAIKENRGVRS